MTTMISAHGMAKLMLAPSVKLSEVKLVAYDFDAAGKARKEVTTRFEDEIIPAPQ